MQNTCKRFIEDLLDQLLTVSLSMVVARRLSTEAKSQNRETARIVNTSLQESSEKQGILKI
jgi:hypothetical protein